MGRPKRRRQKGSGEVYESSPGSWAIRYREGSRRRSQAGFKTKEDAELVLAKVKGEIVQGRAGLPPSQKGVPSLEALAKDFLDRRKVTHRDNTNDRSRWRRHLGPAFGHLKPGDITLPRIRAFIEDRLAAGIASGTIRIFIAMLSSLFADLVERGIVASNPTRNMPKSMLRLIRPSHDPRTTPFIEKLSDVRRIHLLLPEPLNIGYAIGALAGLRTGEVLALKWAHVDLATRRIHVRESVNGPLKDKESRVVPILDPLLPILTKWKLKSGGEVLVVPPLRRDGKKVNKQTPGNYLRPVLKEIGLARPGFGLPSPDQKPQKLWYWCTRHTFASQWVLSGGTIEKLKEMMGHYSVVMTERYAHLRPDLFTPEDLGTIALDLTPGGAETGAIAQRLPIFTPSGTTTTRNYK